MASAHNLGKYFRDMRGGLAVIGFGALVGAGAFVLFAKDPTIKAYSREVYYGTCREALQAGHTNIRPDQPGYRKELDADGDGLACEPYVPLE